MKHTALRCGASVQLPYPRSDTIFNWRLVTVILYFPTDVLNLMLTLKGRSLRYAALCYPVPIFENARS